MSEINEPNHEQIAQRAYELFVARGCEDGLDIEDWLTAEQQLVAEMKPTMEVLVEESRFPKANAVSAGLSATVTSPA